MYKFIMEQNRFTGINTYVCRSDARFRRKEIMHEVPPTTTVGFCISFLHQPRNATNIPPPLLSLEDRYLREVPPTKVGFPHFSTPLLTAKDKPLRFPRFLKSTSRTGILRSYHPDHVFIMQKTTSSPNESTTPIETTNDFPL